MLTALTSEGEEMLTALTSEGKRDANGADIRRKKRC
jgi:hypothetical protein